MTSGDRSLECLASVAREDGPKVAQSVYFALRRFGEGFARKHTEDVVNEVFLTACQIIRSRPERSPDSSPAMLTWLRGIALLKSLEFARKELRQKGSAALRPEELGLVSNHDVIDFVDAYGFSELAEAREKLTNSERQVLDLYFQDRLTTRGIANVLAKDPAAVRKLKQRALDRLRRLLERESA